MHRALHIPDVLETIADYCAGTTLARLAQTSRSFFLPCVKRRWRTADENHLKSLCDMFDAEEKERKTNDSNDVGSRVELYIPHVHRLNLGADPVSCIAATYLLPRLLRIPSTLLAFPRLSSFSLVIREREQIPYLSLFEIGAPLVTVRIRLSFLKEKYHKAITKLIEQIIKKATSLEEFSLVGVPFYPPDLAAKYVDYLFAILHSCSHIKRFASDYFTLHPQLVACLAKQENLTAWQIGLDDHRYNRIQGNLGSEIIPAPDSAIGERQFPMLKEFEFHGDGAIALTILESLRSTLTRVHLDLKSTSLSPAFISSLLEAIRLRGGPVLQDLHLSLEEHRGSAEIITPFSYALLSPILQFPAIRKYGFSLRGHRRLDFDDSHVETMAGAWPDLQDLSIRWGRSGDLFSLVQYSALTFAGILSLTNRCPKLERIVLSAIFDAVLPPCPSQRNSKPLKLVFYDKYVSNVTRVAQFLRRSFTNLKIEDGFFTEGKLPGGWTEVQNELEWRNRKRARGSRKVRN